MTGPDPYRSHRFEVAIGDWDSVGFSEVHGLSVDVGLRSESDVGDGAGEEPDANVGAALDDWIDPGAWPWSGGRRGRRRRPEPPAPQRRTESPPLELTRGVTDDRRLETWLADWVEGTVKPRDVRVWLLDAAGERARGWLCSNATPVRWQGPDLVADRSGVATETLELAHEGIAPIDDTTV